MDKGKYLSLGGSAVGSVGFILISAGAGTGGWISSTVTSTVHRELPSLKDTMSMFTSLGSGDPYTISSSALVLVSTILSAVAMLCNWVHFYLQVNKKLPESLVMLPKIALYIGSLSASCGIAGCIVFAAHYYGAEHYSVGYSFILTIIGCVLEEIGNFISFKTKPGLQIESA